MKEIEIPEGYDVRIEGNKVIMMPKESDDERIKRIITESVYAIYADGEEYNEVLAWFEKHKEQKPIELSNDFETALEQFLMNADSSSNTFAEDVRKYADKLREIVKKEQKFTVGVFTFDDVLALESAMSMAKHNNDSDLYNALQSIFERVHDMYHGEGPKPEEWSEEDERKIELITTYLTKYKHYQTPVGAEYIDKCITWLKSLRPQSMQSKEEFGHLVCDLVTDIVANEHLCESEKRPTRYFVEKYASKFVSRQPHWKPSEEQMCELNWASKLSVTLESLYNDLKKLM